tara:strand:+ start:6691 stop:7971 length:1281 start_codon:yes stop_codon:yes gene_type:complete
MSKIEMIMPKMGESVMECTILKWLKNEGDNISKDDSVVEIATDKVDTEIPSTYSGKLSKILVKEGEIVKVGKPIAIIETINKLDHLDTKNPFTSKIEKDFDKIKKQVSKPILPDNIDISQSDSSKFYSPLVLNIASRENISLDTLEKIKGTGENQRITKLDLLKFIEEKNIESYKVEDFEEDDHQISLNKGEELIEPNRIRKIIASRMVESKKISPHVTSYVEADMTNVYKARNELKEEFLKKHKFPLTFNPIFIHCVTRAIQDFPMINISYINNKIIKKNYINIGIAVALEDDNLIVPVLKDTDKMNFMTIIKESNNLIKKSKENKLIPDDLDGGTFTISNIGSFGNVMGTPIILQPQVGILAIGSIRKIPAVVETKKGDKIKIRNRVFLSHTYDHRIIDGALGGKFVQKVANYLENFDLISNLG